MRYSHVGSSRHSHTGILEYVTVLTLDTHALVERLGTRLSTHSSTFIHCTLHKAHFWIFPDFSFSHPPILQQLNHFNLSPSLSFCLIYVSFLPPIFSYVIPFHSRVISVASGSDLYPLNFPFIRLHLVFVVIFYVLFNILSLFCSFSFTPHFPLFVSPSACVKYKKWDIFL
jgi:hypothetical protein